MLLSVGGQCHHLLCLWHRQAEGKKIVVAHSRSHTPAPCSHRRKCRSLGRNEGVAPQDIAQEVQVWRACHTPSSGSSGRVLMDEAMSCSRPKCLLALAAGTDIGRHASKAWPAAVSHTWPLASAAARLVARQPFIHDDKARLS